MAYSILDEYDGKLGRGRSVHELVDWVESLPPMPAVASRAIRLLDDPNSTPDQVADVLSRDPVLTSQILRVANSAAMAQQSSVSTLDQAVLVTGFGALKAIIMAATLRGYNKTFGPMERLIWDKSLGTATSAFVLCTQLKRRYRDDLFLVGLLHNLGQIVLLSHPEVGAQYPEILEQIRKSGITYAEAEREVVGFSHPLVGSLVAQKWGLPGETCRILLKYDEPFEGIDSDLDEKTAYLQLAAGFSFSAQLGCPEGHPGLTPELQDLGSILGIKDPAQISTFREAIRERFAEESRLYV